MKKSDDDYEAVEQVLGKPFVPDLPEYVQKIRKSLLHASFIGLIVVFVGISIEPDSAVFGITFKGLTDQVMLWSLFIVNIYTWTHFTWCAADNFREWRLRLSGTALAFQTTGTFGSEHCDYPDPRQSTLYTWWLSRTTQLTSIPDSIEAVQQELKSLDEKLKTAFNGDPYALQAAKLLEPFTTKFEELRIVVGRVQSTVESPRIKVSLERFDNAFSLILRSQQLRWILFELGFPILVGAIAMVSLFLKIL